MGAPRSTSCTTTPVSLSSTTRTLRRTWRALLASRWSLPARSTPTRRGTTRGPSWTPVTMTSTRWRARQGAWFHPEEGHDRASISAASACCRLYTASKIFRAPLPPALTRSPLPALVQRAPNRCGGGGDRLHIRRVVQTERHQVGEPVGYVPPGAHHTHAAASSPPAFCR